MKINQINQLVGNMDLYLLDHLLKGRFEKPLKILDAGCGEGRNIMYFLQTEFEVYAVDQNPEAMRLLSFLVKSKWPDYPMDRFRREEIESMSWITPTFDFIISSAVLHFARDRQHFFDMIEAMYRALNSGGLFFCRMASVIGVEGLTPTEKEGWFSLPDGSDRFLLTKELLDQLLNNYPFEYIEPLKTVVVDGKRSMATLMLRKP
jgi:SAM-dependent methyltransferase